MSARHLLDQALDMTFTGLSDFARPEPSSAKVELERGNQPSSSDEQARPPGDVPRKSVHCLLGDHHRCADGARIACRCICHDDDALRRAFEVEVLGLCP